MTEFIQDEQREQLEVRLFLYTVFQSLFGETPSEERVASIDPRLVGQAMSLVGAADAETLPRLLEESYIGLPSLKSSYTKIFLGPGVLPVPLWESVYASHDDVLFTKDTLKVRSFYRQNGLLPSLYPRVADDHIALESGCMAALGQKMVQAADDADAEGFRNACSESRSFIGEHLGKWVNSWAADMASKSGSPLYAAAAAELVANDIVLLERMGN